MIEDDDVIARLKAIVGSRHVLTGEKATERFRKGFRSGSGDALAVVRPGRLIELWKVLEACVAADKIVILQAANTGLTEGSTPKGSYDRDVVLINTLRMNGIHQIRGGEQVLALPGSTLFDLEKMLGKLGREPHSVIGSSCIGASIVGGVCNNSGGALVQRGPSYTELSLFARITETGTLELVNHLDIDLGETPEEILEAVESGRISEDRIRDSNRKASDSAYPEIVRNVDADTPARFNADTRCLHESAGCAGKLAVFAVRLDTFPKNSAEKTFYIGTNDPLGLTELRREILSRFRTLPVSAEYMHRDCFDLSERYGKDTVIMIDKLGTDKLPRFFALKGAIDARLNPFPPLRGLSDRLIQGLSRLWPRVLPRRLMEFRDRYEHHLILKMQDDGIAEARELLETLSSRKTLSYFECDAREAKMAGLNRFAAAGAAVRYLNLHRQSAEDVLALDVALPRNERDWFEKLPPEITEHLSHRLYYGHFMCHVMHQDYIVRKGADPAAIKKAILALLDTRGAEYPAEHNVGHLYTAKPPLAEFYRELDPTNSFNPGIGKTSKKKGYA
ncbi:D-lactate dehydrogenase [Amaricoccus macauensis]|uniref:D-lactate dehydrogenase n=1 Tax=Amaricoccus macauensis TaxID=57001 RepID=UPI003C7E9FEE